jgi:4-hydroxymandelate synthase
MTQQLTLDALELWVSDLDQVHALLTTSFGFRPVPAWLEDDPQERRAFLAHGGVAIAIREDLSPAGPVGRHVGTHGDTVADVVLLSADPAEIGDRALNHGLAVTGPPDTPRIDLLGDGTICHSIRAKPVCPPSLDPTSAHPRGIDHIACCLPWGRADQVAQIYQAVFGLRRLDADSFDEIGGDVSGMRSIVLRSGAGFTVVLTEPANRVSDGQTQRFLDAHKGPGIQHAALRYDDLVSAVGSLRRAGVEFLPIPAAYYDKAQQRLADRAIPWDALRRLEILVDADHEGHLLQLFTRPIADRGTFFFELIERAGATGFGANNVRALFEAVQATIEESR